jgi:ribonucleoside-diphosphate reductase alpha chain
MVIGSGPVRIGQGIEFDYCAVRAAERLTERGIFNRVSAQKQAARTGRRDATAAFVTNPCGEILLRPSGLCNLTEIVVRAEDTLNDLLEKAELATILGTYQSMLTDVRYVRPIWKRNAEEERLLGVSMTGIMDHPQLCRTENKPREWLDVLSMRTIAVNKQWAEMLGINPAASITTVKPSGTVSQLVDSASGIHARYAPHYVRRDVASVPGFGWAKPVPVNPYALERRSPAALMWVSLAGPFTNFILAILGDR